ncbi:MAG TPA: hypothetical protein VFT53_07405 [Candidatus Saccharimonadales bacterium]|nr:hypothetical protein [Candidatus Saccharimonadales bacterium]
MIDLQVVVGKLNGMSADGIAKLFNEEGITGSTFEAFSCPIANYVKRETGQVVGMCAGWIHAGDEKIFFTGKEPMVEFMRRFDRGVYPELRSNRDS